MKGTSGFCTNCVVRDSRLVPGQTQVDNHHDTTHLDKETTKVMYAEYRAWGHGRQVPI